MTVSAWTPRVENRVAVAGRGEVVVVEVDAAMPWPLAAAFIDGAEQTVRSVEWGRHLEDQRPRVGQLIGLRLAPKGRSDE